VRYLIRIVIVTPAAYTLRPVVRQHGPAGYQCRLAWQSRAPAAAAPSSSSGAGGVLAISIGALSAEKTALTDASFLY
jgi:hypothetical protein